MQTLMMKPWLFGSVFVSAIAMTHALQTLL